MAFFFTGFHPDYHRPTDTPEKIDYPKNGPLRVVRLGVGPRGGGADSGGARTDVPCVRCEDGGLRLVELDDLTLDD